MPTLQSPKLRLHRDTVRRLGAPAPGRLATDPVAHPGDTAFCGPSRLSLCDAGCETA
jgi:hypothetical protein